MYKTAMVLLLALAFIYGSWNLGIDGCMTKQERRRGRGGVHLLLFEDSSLSYSTFLIRALGIGLVDLIRAFLVIITVGSFVIFGLSWVRNGNQSSSSSSYVRTYSEN